jgi:hypothetical protein
MNNKLRDGKTYDRLYYQQNKERILKRSAEYYRKKKKKYANTGVNIIQRMKNDVMKHTKDTTESMPNELMQGNDTIKNKRDLPMV